MILSDEQKTAFVKGVCYGEYSYRDIVDAVEAAVLSAVEARQAAELNESVTTTLKTDERYGQLCNVVELIMKRDPYWDDQFEEVVLAIRNIDAAMKGGE